MLVLKTKMECSYINPQTQLFGSLHAITNSYFSSVKVAILSSAALLSPPPKQGCRRVPKSKQYTIAEVITATSSSNAWRQALGSKQAQERSGSSSTKKACGGLSLLREEQSKISYYL